MGIEIPSEMQLNRAQTIAGLVLSVLGIGWFIFLSNVVKIKAFHRIRRGGGLPVLESIVPTNMIEVVKILRINMAPAVIVICTLVMVGLTLTVFDSLIIPNTVSINESCRTANAMRQARMLNPGVVNTLWAYFEVEEMRTQRKKSGVPDDVLTGHVPNDTRWKFDSKLDVDPYPWRTSCSLYNSGTIQTRMNTSLLDPTFTIAEPSDLPEVNEQFKFSNIPKGYVYNNIFWYRFFSYVTLDDGTGEHNGTFIMAIETFTKGNTSEVGSKQIDRLWTLRVPETTQMILENEYVFITVPIVVKAYTCEMERVKEGDHGSVNLLQNDLAINGMLETVGELIGNKWYTANLNNEDTSLYEITPDYWTSFLTVQGIRKRQVEEVLIQISVPCIGIHTTYILLVCMYVTLTIIGIACWCTALRRDFEIPTTSVEWASLACKESSIEEHPKEAKLGVTPYNSKDLKILSKRDENY